MFPLGTVLFPHTPLQLHVFEPRYRALVADCLAGDRELGVVLIERGSEVGGGDVRSGVGTRARIRNAHEHPDGRWSLLVVGLGRLHVRVWQPDDPYPLAEVDDLDDEIATSATPGLLSEALDGLREVVELRHAVGEWPDPTVPELHDDPAVAVWQAAWLSGLGPFDAQAVLACADLDARIALLTRLLHDEADVLTFRLGGAPSA